jgi:putative oxidoreductase
MFKALFRPVPFVHSSPQVRASAAILFLRVALAAIFIYHGLEKILGEGNEWGANWLAGMVQAPPGTVEHSSQMIVLQLGVAWGEVLGGTALAIGLLTRLAAAGLFLIQIAAICLAFLHPSFSLTKHGGGEYNVALLAMCAAVVFLGAGRYSVDRLLHLKRRQAK